MFKATCNATRTVITGKNNKLPVGDWITALSAMSPPYLKRLLHKTVSAPETAATPGGLYLILQSAFQEAAFESLQVRPLSQ